jgi:cytochrome P450
MILPLALGFPLLILLLLLLLYLFIFLPPRYPTNIPAVPFWVTLLPFIKDVDQEETYRTYLAEPLRQHGAVKIFFGARWNVLVAKPEFMAQIFRDEGLFRKSGNHEKIPHSVFAEFLGENVISAHGDLWKTFRGVVRPGLSGSFDGRALRENTARLGDLIRRDGELEREKGVVVQELLQRYTIANTAQSLFRTDFKVLHSLVRDEEEAANQRQSLGNASGGLSSLQTAVKREIFKPIFMNFPFLDRFPFPSRRYARELVAQFSQMLQDGIERTGFQEEAGGEKPHHEHSQSLSARLLDARDSGLLSQKQFRDNLNVLFIASQENPQIALTSTLFLLAKHPEVQAKVYEEAISARGDSELDSLPYLTATILESLRLYPPISQLINRLTTAPAILSSSSRPGEQVVIPAGTYVGYHAYSTNRDTDIWGPDAEEFKPERWGCTMPEIQGLYRRVRTKGGFVSFHGGRRACLGERFAMLEMRVAVFGLVRRFVMALGKERVWMMPVSYHLFPFGRFIGFFGRRKGVRTLTCAC